MSSALSGLANEAFLKLFQSDLCDDKPIFVFCDMSRKSSLSRQIMLHDCVCVELLPASSTIKQWPQKSQRDLSELDQSLLNLPRRHELDGKSRVPHKAYS